MTSLNWRGVLPAITTPFAADGTVDHSFLAEHARWMADAGSIGIVPCGSLGEGATLTFDEKVAVMATLVEAVPSLPVIPGIAALSTDEAVRLAQAAQGVGCRGLMILPPYVYSTDWREMGAHIRAVLDATELPAMLYNNPLAYKTDFLPPQVAELALSHPQLEAIKESSGDARRVTALRAQLGDRLEVLVGVDDCIVEGVMAGATGWIAGLVNAFPHESVRLYELAMAAAREGGDRRELEALYDWFMPLLKLDVVPKFVQLIKLVQAEVGQGSERVRAPRLPVEGEEREAAMAVIREGLLTRPAGGSHG